MSAKNTNTRDKKIGEDGNQSSYKIKETEPFSLCGSPKMALMFQPWHCLSLTLSLSVTHFPSLSSAQPHSSQDTDTQNLAMSMPPSSSNRKVVIAIVATFTITLMVAAILFLFYDKCGRRRRGSKIDTSSGREAEVTSEEFRRFGGKVKGLIVEENGRDFIYVKNLEDRKLETKFSKVVLNPSFEEEEMRDGVVVKRTKIYKPQEVKVTESAHPNQQSPGITPSVQNPAPPEPATPPPPPPPPALPTVRHSVPPLPPPKAGGLASSLRPPPAPRWNTNNKSGSPGSTEESAKGTNVGNMKLKPLHWDKVIANADHSVVWNEIIDGSLRFDDNEIETLFGYTTASRKNPQGNGVLSSINSPSPASTAQIFILDSRKSQNTAIILKSLTVSRNEILDALLEGHGLTIDALEKLSRIALTQEESAKILQFRGNPSKLADAESFLYYILKDVPSAFVRINAMLFRSNYDSEILHLKESLQTLELGCKELRTRGLFFKLLEAILKAGNRMNAGTSRGNAQGFNLTALRKISDVKSTDGKTTLLHFVVEQVIRSEGRRCIINQNLNRNVERINTQGKTNSDSSTSDAMKEAERDREYLQIGLQALRGLSLEFTNVKRAATTIEYQSFINTCSSLTVRVTEIRQLITQCGNGEKGGFVREMRGFLEETEEEIKVVEEEQTRIMDLVKRTTDYYQAGALKHERENLLQLFVIVKDFLEMVDQVCMDISHKMQKKNVAANAGSTSPPLLPARATKYPDFRLHLVSESSRIPSSSESDDDF